MVSRKKVPPGEHWSPEEVPISNWTSIFPLLSDACSVPILSPTRRPKLPSLLYWSIYCPIQSIKPPPPLKVTTASATLLLPWRIAIPNQEEVMGKVCLKPRNTSQTPFKSSPSPTTLAPFSACKCYWSWIEGHAKKVKELELALCAQTSREKGPWEENSAPCSVSRLSLGSTHKGKCLLDQISYS